MTDPAISIKINGKKYVPVGNSRQPSVSVTAADAAATTGPKTIAPKALIRKAVLMRRSMPMGILTALKMTRSATISAAKIRTRVFLNSEKACFQYALENG